MKRTLIVVAVVLLLVEPGFAAPCNQATWDVYLGLADCTIGNNTLSKFDYTNDPLRPFDAMGVTARPEGIGFQFSLSNFSLAEALRTRSITLKFSISGVDAYLIETLDMSADMAVVTTGGGVAGITDPIGLNVTKSGLAIKLTDEKIFSPPLAAVDVADTLKLDIGMNGSAQIRQFLVQVRPVSEPPTWYLFAAGVLALSIVGCFPWGFRSLGKHDH